ncbi:MAG: DUF4838 domain-containing protein [Candidatus Ratteibacteria bacterium]
MEKYWIGLVLMMGFAVWGYAADIRLPLVTNGKAEAVLVIPADAMKTDPKKTLPEEVASNWSSFSVSGTRSVEMAAATLLVDHIRQMSGASIPVVSDRSLRRLRVDNGRVLSSSSAKTYILIGESDITKKLGLTCDGLQPGGIMAVTTKNAVVLAGPKSSIDPDGTFRAAVAFLESLGCRYLWPGELGKVIPKSRTLSVAPLNIRFSSPIPQRELRWWAFLPSRPSAALTRGCQYLGIDANEWAKRQDAALVDVVSQCDWRAWNGLTGFLRLKGSHSGAGIKLSPKWREALEEHPEWFSLQADGTRSYHERFRLCKSNLALIDFVAKGIIEYAKAHPERMSISVSPNDGGYSSFCMCEECKKLDPPNAPKVTIAIFAKQGESKRTRIEYPSLTDRMIWYYNHIAEKVTKECPNLLFVVDAYSVFKTAPVREKPHPNLVFRYVGYDKEAWNAWRASGAKNIYWRPNIFWEGATLGQIHLVTDKIADWLHFSGNTGTIATDFDSILDHWALQGLNYYVAARANWDPNLGRDAIIKDYCQAGFGSGASYVEEYFKISEDATTAQNWDEEKIKKLRTLLDSAERAAGVKSVESRRLDFLRIGLNFHHIHTLLINMNKDATEKKPVDRAYANRLLILNYVMMRDIAKNHVLAVHTPFLIWRSANLAHLGRVGGRNFQPPEEIVNATEGKSMTGQERSLEELMAVYGLDTLLTGTPVKSSPAKKSPAQGKPIESADEEGQAIEL